MAFTTTLTGVADVDDSILLAFDQAFIIAASQTPNVEQLVQHKVQINAKSIQFPKYSLLTVDAGDLTEADDPASLALVDAPILLTPTQCGRVVTRTELSSLQTGGTVDIAAAQLVGKNMAETMDYRALAALKASTNIMTPAGDNVAANVASTDIMSRTFLNKLYSKLAGDNVPFFSGSEYVLVAHEKVIYDMRADTAAGSWTDVSKYSDLVSVLKNEVGMYMGFRVVRNNRCQVVADEGAGAVDNYYAYAVGFNGLGKATSQEGRMVITMSDKLERFLNIGWKATNAYGIIDTSAVVKAVTASSLGANT